MATTERESERAARPPRDGGKDGAPRLAWSSKPTTVERVALPFQVVETINESRATREAERGSLFASSGNGRAATGWRNKLVWGDNKLVAASLLDEFAGQVNLVYIDPPFDTGTDFSFRVRVGDEHITKKPSIIEEHAYSDTWGAGRSSYLRMMYERIVLIWELLAEGGSFYLHCAPNVSHYLKVLCDEVFGVESFRNEIIWKRTTAHSDTKQGLVQYGKVHDVLLFYSKGSTWQWNTVYTDYDDAYVGSKYRNIEEGTGRRYRTGDLTAAKPGGDTSFEWRVKTSVNSDGWEADLDDEWRRPEPGWEYRAVTPYRGRFWAYSRENLHAMAADGRIIHTATGMPEYKRYLDEMPGVAPQDTWTDIDPINSQARERVGFDTQKPLALLERIITLSSNEGDLVCDLFVGSGTSSVAAERLNRRWIAADLGRFAIHTTRKRLLSQPDCSPFEILNLGSYERQHWQQGVAGGEIDAYINFILSLYDAQPVDGYRLLHGKRSNRLVHIGAVDAPVTIDEVDEVMDELAANDLPAVDVLGWEWEMGLHDVVTERARRRGLDLACRQIPREVMSAELDDEVRFFELAYLDLEVDRQGRSVRVQLRDFVIPSEELIPESVRSKISQWSDYIDYWAVDFNFRDDTFHNEWQTYRTRDEPKLATESDWHDYETPGGYAIVIKVIDIFGNDTTKLAEVQIK
jgi:adenine-specific DNA-methyltransferase